MNSSQKIAEKTLEISEQLEKDFYDWQILEILELVKILIRTTI